MAAADLTQERLKELLHYDPETGIFTWLFTNKYSLTPAGTFAGYINHGYIKISVDGRQYPAHRLAWLYMHGQWPATKDMDHKNGVRSDNKFANLREATRSQNIQNLRKARSDSKSGLLGTAPNYGRWRAQINVNGKIRHLGNFGTAQEAHECYLEAKRKLHEFCEI